ncbi:MAG: hypothetical protein EB084_18985 [Proteobacteria bacterium]|nr:hypothetical protein [Pseudomonadota bacterium]
MPEALPSRAPHLRPPASTPTDPLSDLSNERLLETVKSTASALIDATETDRVASMARELLTGSRLHGEIDTPGVRSLLYQLIRNRDPEMQLNHITELRLAHMLARVGCRRLSLERKASERNERTVDFALDDDAGSFLVEVKNLNRPLIKKSLDLNAQRLQEALQGSARHSDLHLFYLFFRKPHPDDFEVLRNDLRRQWLTVDSVRRDGGVFFTPSDRPRVGALVTPARPSSAGRVIVYDHGQHLREQGGAPIRITHHERPALRRPRQRLEEMFIKDNVLRRLQDAEQKFPLHERHGRAVLLCPGDWAPAHHVDGCIDEAVHWYLHGQTAPGDMWASYYAHWAGRWRFSPQRNIDAIYVLHATSQHAAASEGTGPQIRTVYERIPGLAARIFLGA